MNVCSPSYPSIPFDISQDFDRYSAASFPLGHPLPLSNSCLSDTLRPIVSDTAAHLGKRFRPTAHCEPAKRMQKHPSRSPTPLQHRTSTITASSITSTSISTSTTPAAAATAAASSSTRSGKTPSHIDATVETLEDKLHHLRDEWATIDIVLASLRNAFPVHLSASEEEIDRELSIAYDDLKGQVRHLERSLRRLETEILSLQKRMDKARRPS